MTSVYSYYDDKEVLLTPDTMRVTDVPPLSIVAHSKGTAKSESILLALEEKPQGEDGEWGDRAMSLCPHRSQLPAASQEHAHLLCVVSQL